MIPNKVIQLIDHFKTPPFMVTKLGMIILFFLKQKKKKSCLGIRFWLVKFRFNFEAPWLMKHVLILFSYFSH